MNNLSETEIQTYGDMALAAIAKHTGRIFKRESKVIADKDPENLHQMRVGMRRLRSAIAAFEGAIDLPQSVSEPKVAKMAKILGKLRDIDVLKASLKDDYLPQLASKQQKKLQQAIKGLEKRRKPALKKVRATVEGDLYRDFKQDLLAWLDKPRYKTPAQLPLIQVLPDLLLPLVSHLFLHPGWLVGAKVKGENVEVLDLEPEVIDRLLGTQSEDLHDLRKQAKRSRYNLELFLSFYDDEYRNFVDQIEAIQETLGAIQDTAIMSEYLQQVWQSKSQTVPAITTRLTQIRQEKYVAWQQLQRQLLDFEHRQHIRRLVQQPRYLKFD